MDALSRSSFLSDFCSPRTTTMAETDDSTTATTNPPNTISFPDLDHTLSPTFEELMKDVPCNFVEAADYTASTFDSDWGFIYTNQGPSGTWKNGGGGSRYSSSDCWSAVSETLNSSWHNNSCIDSNQDASGSATPKLINIASFNSCIEVGCGEEDKRKGRLKRKKNVGDKESEIHFEHNSGDIHSLASESDGDEIASSESSGAEMLSEPSVYFNEENQEVKIQVPEIGLVFSSEEEAYKFYKNYAGVIGFSVRKGKVQRIATGAIRKRYFFCSRQGFRSKKQHEKKTKYKRKETRTGCEAKVQFTVDNGKWKISHVILEHNHATESPRPTGKTGSCTEISEANSIIPIVSEAEAGIVSEAGNAKHMGFHNMECSNYLRDKKINLLQPEDSQSLLNYLKHLQVEDPLLFYSVQVDAENRITNFFWRDGRSKIDYDYFGDIIILDTTFRMSIYDMICIPFWGLNHHQQYVLFGCAFMLDESIDSLIWLLGTFMEAMGTRQPKTILTDESKAMEKAIKAVLPKTQHCLCMRHICQNARKHLSAYFGEPDFESLFNKCIFDCQSEEELESTWESLLKQHNLRENSWLNTIYMLRDKWSHVFCKKTFSAGVQSNQGSENINNIFQNVVSEIMTLPKFVQQYERAAQQRRREELYEDFRCKGSASSLTLRNSAMEKQAANMYTHTMFKIFQGELLGCLSVAIEEISNAGSMVATFKLTEEGDEKENLVEFSCVDSKVTCSCGKFESVGILCFHALKVLNARNIFHIPPQYLLKRWTKHAKEGFVEDDHGAERHDKSHRPLTLCASKLVHKALNVITKSLAFDESRKMAEDYLDTALKSVEYLLKTKNIEHLDKNDVEVDCGDKAGEANGIGRMGTQKVMFNSPCVDLEEESSQGMRNQIENRCNDEVGETARNSCYGTIRHSQPPQEITKGSGGLGFSHPSYFSRDLAAAEQQQPVQYWSDDALNLSGRRRKMMVNRFGKDGRSVSRPPLPTNTTKIYKGVRQGHWGKWGGETLLPQHRTRPWSGTFYTAEDAAKHNFPGVFLSKDKAVSSAPSSIISSSADSQLKKASVAGFSHG